MIHTFKLSGKNLVFDVNTSTLHVVDEPAYLMLSTVGQNWPQGGISPDSDAYAAVEAKFGISVANETLREIVELHEAGVLYSDDVFENLYEDTVKQRIDDPVIKAMCMHVSHDCNLRCRYCFAGTGNFGGTRKNMSPEIAIKAIDFLIKNSYGRKNLEIDFFGGEPLLAMDTIRAAVEYGEKRGRETGKSIHFTITTNATLLNDEISAYINEKMDNLVISIDGRKEIHDFLRSKAGGTGSYDEVMKNARSIISLRGDKQYFVRGTFTRHNLDFSRDVKHLSESGFESISVEPVVTDMEKSYSIREEDLETIYREYEELAIECLDKKMKGIPLTFYHFEVDLDDGPCLYKRIGGCGSGVEYVAVTPDGDIYPCHQFVGNREYLMGTIDEGVKDLNIRRTFAENNIYTIAECKNCWAKFLCSGGCAASALQYGGGLDKPYKIGCSLEKKRLECALWIKASSYS